MAGTCKRLLAGGGHTPDTSGTVPRLPSSNRNKAGIIQIAAKLGVSTSTVSRALRPETAHLVNESRRKEILEIAERYHYSPNPGARMLRRGGNTRLTVVVPLDENIFFSEFYGRFLAGTLHAAASRRWGVQICTLQIEKNAGFRETMQQLSLESSGLIYLAEPLSVAAVQELKGYRRPFVLTKSALPIDLNPLEIGVPVIGVDNRGGARSVVRLLLQLGHRKIGLLLGPSGSRDAHERRLGYLEALSQAGASPRAEWIFGGPFNAETGRAGLSHVLASNDRPTALCCANDEIAFGAVNAAQLAGMRCPEDISVVGFDDGLWATSCHPALTTVSQPLADMAERAVSLIVEAATAPGSTNTARLDEMSAPIVIRESTTSVRGGGLG